MKRDIYATFRILTGLAAALLAAPAAVAQETRAQDQEQEQAAPDRPGEGIQDTQDTQSSQDARDRLPESAAEMVTDYLEQDIFLRPGVGLKKVKLGMSFEAVLQAWGEPDRRERRNVFGNKWTYEIGDDSRIVLAGGDNVETMRILGGINSPYTTTEGASFGMPRHQIATIYGARETESSKVNYSERGVGFTLDQGQVSEIRIFAPK